MSDIVDQAQELEEAERDDGLADVRRRIREGDWRELSAHECESCGESIPEARREAVVGVQYCVDCQARIERERRSRGW